jgi:CelD/BcsL family acetyltransferase involved in cellulose biosynthesis
MPSQQPSQLADRSTARSDGAIVRGLLMGSLTVMSVTDEAVLAQYANQWLELLGRSSTNRPMLTPFWLLAWWRLFGPGEGRRLATLLVFDGKRLVGLAPLSSRLRWHRRAIPFRRIELLATGERQADEIASDYLGLIADRGYEQAVTDAVVDALDRGVVGPWDEIVLTAMDGEAPTTQMLRSVLVARGETVEDLAAAPSPYIRLPARWEDYLAALPGSGRYLINRSLRDFERWAGSAATVERVQSLADIAEGRRILVSLHEERWKAAGRQGVFASRVFSEFHAAVLPELLARDGVDLAWLEVRGRPVAVAYNFVWDNRVLFYQGGRTVDVPKGVRPGIVLHVHLIKAAIAAGRSEYDFLPGLSQYKQQLSTALRPLAALRVIRAPIRDLARRTLERGIAYLRERRRARTAVTSAQAPSPSCAPKAPVPGPTSGRSSPAD